MNTERLPYPSPENHPPELPSANMVRMWAHSPATLRPGMALGTACISSLSIPVNLREILSLFCGVKFECQYIWVRHINDAKKAGVTASQIDALQNRDLQNPEAWDERDIAFLAFLDEVIDSPVARDESFLEASKWFDERQLVEIIIAQVRLMELLLFFPDPQVSHHRRGSITCGRAFLQHYE
jgi:alkylhydroperoxidase family enzyme